METKPNIIARVIHFLYDREGSKHALINTITNLCSHAITEHLKEEPNRFPSLLFYLVFHCGDIAENPCPVTSSLSWKEKAG